MAYIALNDALNRFPNLQWLDLSYCRHFTNFGLCNLLCSLPGLVHLRSTHNPQLNDLAMVQVAQDLRLAGGQQLRLEHLDVSFTGVAGNGISELSTYTPSLSYLALCRRTAIPCEHSRCVTCGQGEDRERELRLLLCAVCRVSAYCSKQCQRTDWPLHR